MSFYRTKNKSSKIAPTKPEAENYYEHYSCDLPKPLVTELKRLAKENSMPVARFLAYALYNELDQEEPFKFKWNPPSALEIPYVEDQFHNESQILFKHISRMGNACALDILLLCKGTIGLTEKQILLAYRELLEKGVIEEYNKSSRFMKYPANYKGCRVYRYNTEKVQAVTKYKDPTKGPLDDV